MAFLFFAWINLAVFSIAGFRAFFFRDFLGLVFRFAGFLFIASWLGVLSFAGYQFGLFFAKNGGEGEIVERGAFFEDADEVALPGFFVGGEADFLLEALEALEHELADVGHGNGVLALDAAGGEQDEDSAESGIDGGGGLEILDAGEDIGGDVVACGETVELTAQVLVAKFGVAGKHGSGAAAAVESEVGAAWGRRLWRRKG